MARSSHKINLRKHRVLAGLSAIALAGSWAATAQAQDGAVTEEADDSEIVVTGTFLNVRQEDRASPVVTVDAEALDRTGVSSLGDLTRFIPQNVGSAGGLQDLAKGGG